MKSFLYPHLIPPSFVWNGGYPDHPQRVNEWIKPIQEKPEEGTYPDIVMLGVPLSRSSISASGASEFPEYFRRAWKGFATYNIDHDVDLNTMKIVDAGDVPMHVTDISACHQNIREASLKVHQEFSQSMICSIGGDHSITAMLVKGMHDANPTEKIGILQFDTHFDLRDLTDNGPSNGTPMRNLIESNVVEGANMYNIGLHGFFNNKDLKVYADEKGVNYYTLRETRRKGIVETVAQCLEELESKVDRIYVTVDMDVLDIAYAPGVPASTPGGMTSGELLEAVWLAGRHPKVKAMDIVCLDPLRDLAAQPTVKMGTHVFLTFLTGLAKR
ncbi:agmatinase family protein [Peribacillus acanthi]|uniref:agmatinase family protein n=1 Tax=Peribacillus acanthi TaxID=2171554 RepID=UPI00196AFDCC|nr:agmatinase family protein [Peribacillus acanthi]